MYLQVSTVVEKSGEMKEIKKVSGKWDASNKRMQPLQKSREVFDVLND